MITYAEAIQIYARVRGLKRGLIVLPGMPLELMVIGVDQLTPVPANIARPLIDGMRSNSIVKNEAASQVFPEVKPIDYPQAIANALSKLSPAHIEPVWENCVDSVKIFKHAGFLINSQQMIVAAGPEVIYRILTGLGGKSGWLYLNSLWRLRGLLDRLIRGPGMRGRQAGELSVGYTIDFYRVEALEPGKLFRLQAELKAPGAGWMEWRIKPQTGGTTSLLQIAYFAPKGMAGFIYWYFLYPVHRLVFSGLIKGIARRAIEHQQLS